MYIIYFKAHYCTSVYMKHGDNGIGSSLKGRHTRTCYLRLTTEDKANFRSLVSIGCCQFLY